MADKRKRKRKLEAMDNWTLRFPIRLRERIEATARRLQEEGQTTTAAEYVRDAVIVQLRKDDKSMVRE